MSQREVLLQIKNMYKNFGATVALNNVSFEMCRGEIRGLVGENGSGKSTLMKTLLGQKNVVAGKIEFGDGLKQKETTISDWFEQPKTASQMTELLMEEEIEVNVEGSVVYEN